MPRAGRSWSAAIAQADGRDAVIGAPRKWPADLRGAWVTIKRMNEVNGRQMFGSVHDNRERTGLARAPTVAGGKRII